MNKHRNVVNKLQFLRNLLLWYLAMRAAPSPKNSGMSSGCAEVKLEQLFSVQRVPALVSKNVRIPSFTFFPWGSQLDLKRCQAFR